ncbi:MAG: DUF4292 domain-containing protein [Bacteroidia bacterium]|jgi:outer membrane lipoprotein-sorting protein|nr:DUF4292 domain-containing protein [Bacteroidia bacterium]
MSKQLLFVSLFVFVVLAAPSCRSTRKVMKAPLKEYGENYLLDRMKEAQLNYEWFSSRLIITLTDDKKNTTELRGQLRIRRDSAIWISLTPMLNIEAARLLITPDSVKLINRLDKTYYNDDFTLINNLFSSSADFFLLQSLLTGNDLVNYETENFRSAIDSREYRLSTTGRAKKKRYLRKNEQQQILVQSIWLNPENYKISRINLKEVGDETHKLQVTYSAFETSGNLIVPTQLQFEVNASRRMMLNIRYQKPELDVPQPMPFRIPDNFSKMK